MADVFPVMTQTGVPENRVVQSQFGKENQGFLLCRESVLGESVYWAHYVDDFKEKIDPTDGNPRPEPDPATRTKRVKVPQQLQGVATQDWIRASMFSGQMRKVVQCQHSRGINTPFSHTWTKTHGILEFPFPHVVGSSKGEEAGLNKKRRFWIVEISANGVYVAPIGIGTECLTCAHVGLKQYVRDSTGKVDLDFFYNVDNPGNTIKQVLSSIAMEPAYFGWNVWYPNMGWAFSYSGRKASNVVYNRISDVHAINTKQVILEFAISFPVTSATITFSKEVLFGITTNVCHVTLPGHGIEEGGIAVIIGADQPEYNGAFVARNVTSTGFDYYINGEPTSPATGEIYVSNGASNATITGSLTTGLQGQVSFRRGSGGTLWIPKPGAGDGAYEPIVPALLPVIGGGPVHVYYDGEDEVTTSWSYTSFNDPYTISAGGSDQWGATNVHDGWPITRGWDTSAETQPVDVPCLAGENQFTAVIHDPNHSGTAEGGQISWASPGSSSGDTTTPIVTQTWGFTGGINLGQVSSRTWQKKDWQYGTGGGAEFILSEVYSFADWQYDPGCTGIIVCYPPEWNRDPPCYELLIVRDDYKVVTWAQEIHSRMVSTNETESGCSACILLPYDREALLGLRTRDTSSTGTESNADFLFYTKQQYLLVPQPYRANIFPGVEYQFNGVLFGTMRNRTDVSVNNSLQFGEYSLQAAGGLSLNEAVNRDDNDIVWQNLKNFVGYNPLNPNASSGFMAMHGALLYDDPYIEPRNQWWNRVFWNGEYGTVGGFPTLTGTPVAFVGKV